MGESGQEIQNGQPSKEAVAKSRVREIDVPGTFVHVTTLTRLASTLRDGLISENLARRSGKEARMRWPNYEDANPDKIFAGQLLEVGDLQRSAIDISNPLETDQIATLILKPDVRGILTPTEDPTKFLADGMIEPSNFEGIAIGGSREALDKADYSDYMPQIDKNLITSLNANVELIEALKARCLRIMRSVYGKDVTKYLPIYDMKGKVIWPNE